jgi:hypothetical protein
MATVELERQYLSVARILRATNPKEELTNELVAFLGTHLKAYGIRWNPKAFRAGLSSPEVPMELLRKLEDFLGVAESLNWVVPKSVVDELDRIIEDIESCNPAFVNSLGASRASGRVPASAVKKRLGA